MIEANQPRRAGLVGTGLIGGSVGLALRASGWHVTGTDAEPARAERALELGVIDAVGTDEAAELTFLAVPVSAVPDVARRVLELGGVVTDVGSVKAPTVAAVDHPRFVGGHPMAGSEAVGVEGARPDLFDGAAWVLTPTTRTDEQAHALVHSVVRSFGADVLTLAPEQHDRLVATVSHVPHLTAAALMRMAAARGQSDGALLRLAAGGFRDMTRIAAGDPGMWLDVCAENRDAILEVIDELTASLGDLRRVVDDGDPQGLERMLRDAQTARRSLPTGAPPAEQLAEVRVQIPDEPGQLAAVTSLATELSVNVYDVEVAHSAEERGGRLILGVAAARAADLVDELGRRGRVASAHELA
ncbi:MAG: prephenate dehydrogenase/arogenate dehydrogenase family protein [Microthrixaceae bacterium]